MTQQSASVTVDVHACAVRPTITRTQALQQILAAERCTKEVYDWLSNINDAALTTGARDWLSELDQRVSDDVQQDADDAIADWQACEDARFASDTPQSMLVRVSTRMAGGSVHSTDSAAKGLLSRLQISLSGSNAGGGGGGGDDDDDDPCPPIDSEIVFEFDEDGLDIPEDVILDDPVKPDDDQDDSNENDIVQVAGNLQIYIPAQHWNLGGCLGYSTGVEYFDYTGGEAMVGPIPGQRTYRFPVFYDEQLKNIRSDNDLVNSFLMEFFNRTIKMKLCDLSIVGDKKLIPPPGIEYEMPSGVIRAHPENASGFITIYILIEWQTPESSYSQLIPISAPTSVDNESVVAGAWFSQESDYLVIVQPRLGENTSFANALNSIKSQNHIAGKYKFYLGVFGILDGQQSVSVKYDYESIEHITTLRWQSLGGAYTQHMKYTPSPKIETEENKYVYESSFIFDVYDIEVNETAFSYIEMPIDARNNKQTITFDLSKNIINGPSDNEEWIYIEIIITDNETNNNHRRRYVMGKGQNSKQIIIENIFASSLYSTSKTLDLYVTCVDMRLGLWSADGSSSMVVKDLSDVYLYEYAGLYNSTPQDIIIEPYLHYADRRHISSRIIDTNLFA